MAQLFNNNLYSTNFNFVNHKCPCLTGEDFSKKKIGPSSLIMNLMSVFGYKCGPSDMHEKIYIIVFLLNAGQP